MDSLQNARRRPRGFSLIEVLVAFAIMAMSLMVLYRAMGGGIRDVSGLEQRQRAAMLAYSLLQAGDDVLPGDRGREGVEGGLVWKISIQPYGTDTGAERPEAVRLHLLVISVSWHDAGTAQQLELRTLRPERKPPRPKGGA